MPKLIAAGTQGGHRAADLANGFDGTHAAAELLNQLERLDALWAIELKEAVAAHRAGDGRHRDESGQPMTRMRGGEDCARQANTFTTEMRG